MIVASSSGAPLPPTPVRHDMARKYLHPQAVQLAGRIYGICLLRNSDEAGFNHMVNVLTNGEASVRDLVIATCQSDEFREKFLMNQSPNEMAREFYARFIGISSPSAEDIKKYAIKILEQDWRDFISELFDSDEYMKKYGEDKLPGNR